MRCFPFVCLLALFVVFVAGCGAHANSNTSIEVTITDVFPNHSIQAGDAAVTLTATVQNDSSNRGVTWSLSVANTGCSPGCGTLVPSDSLSAVYTPPAVAPLNQNATITATSVRDPRQTYAFNFTIIPLTSVTVTNKFSSIIAGGPSVNVNATVNNDPSGQGATWTLTAGGTDCSPACGTLVASAAPSFSAQYTPPAIVPAGANASPTITARSVQRAAANDSFSFTIASAASLVKGNLTFLLRGYDSSNGNPMAMAGAIVADGNGNITGGEVDFNVSGGVDFVSPPATGTYTVDPSFNGIVRGTIEISSYHFPGTTSDLQFRFALSADGSHGRIIELDGIRYLNSGVIQMQDPSALTAAPSGNFAFGLDSDAPFAGRIVSVGQLVLGAAGITGGIIDQSKSADPLPTYSGAAISPSAVNAPDSNGRGTFSIQVNGNSTLFAYYIVSAQRFHLIQIDRGLLNGSVFAGVARQQKMLTADSINATSVLQMTGMDEPTGTSNVGPDVTIGVMTISGGNTFNLTLDNNDLGTVITAHPADGTITSFDPATGRAVISSDGGFNAGFVDSAVLYLYDQGAGFIIDTDISTPDGTPPDQAITNNAFSGTLTPQVAGPFSATSVSGNLIAGFGGSASPSIPNFDLALNFDANAGAYTAEGDLTSLPTQDDVATDFQFFGQYRLLDSVLGHGRLTLPAGLFGDFTSGNTDNASFYLIGPNQFVSIGITPGQYSGVAFFDPQ